GPGALRPRPPVADPSRGPPARGERPLSERRARLLLEPKSWHLHSQAVQPAQAPADSRRAGVWTRKRSRSTRARSPRCRGGDMMKLSARNVMKGRVVKVTRGATTAHVKIDVGGGTVMTASITVEAVDELGLREGDAPYAVVKASDVIVAKD